MTRSRSERAAATPKADAPERARPSPFQAARWSRSGEALEREAGNLADAVMRGGAPRAVPSSPAGGPTPTGGQALNTETRAFFEPRFGADFSRVRVYSDEQARETARDAGALAYALGRQIVWGAREAPESRAARPLLAHELAHVAANHTAAEPSTGFRQTDEKPVLPTQHQRDEVLGIFNPQSSQESKVDPVADPDGFVAALKARARLIRAARLPGATAVQTSPVVLGTADLTDLVPIAEREIRKAFGSYFSAKVDLSGIRARMRYLPADPGTAPASDEATLSAESLEGMAVAAVRVGISRDAEAQKIIKDHNVIPGGRDDALYQRALTEILAENPAEWRKIGLSVRGVNGPDLTLIQRRIVPAAGESHSQTRRRGRWMNLGTAIHEMLHAITSPDFSDAVRGTEQGDLGVEGFTEFFTRALYEDIQARAASDPALRLEIEGAAGPAFTPPPRTSYEDFFTQVKEILGKLDGNEENLRQAYFKGKVEYIGLGQWNEISRGLPTKRRHEIGGAFLFQTKEGSFSANPLVSVNYGYLLWGHSGSVQVDLRGGAGITFLGEGQRLGLGPDLSLTLRGNHLFLTGGAMFQGGGSLAGGEEKGGRLDTVLRVGVGGQVGHLQVGAGVHVLVPIKEPDTARRGTQVFAGLGASFLFGKK